jgi:hypothetical protein
MNVLLRGRRLILRWAFWFDGFSGLHVGVVTLRVCLAFVLPLVPRVFGWSMHFFLIIWSCLVFAFSWILGTWMGSFLLLSNHLLAMHSSRGRLRNQVDMYLGVYMMSDWPDDSGFVCVVLSSHFSYHFSGVLLTHSGWVVDNIVWTNSWSSIVGAGCGLTRVGAGEEQAWKVVAGEASRCGEDK